MKVLFDRLNKNKNLTINTQSVFCRDDQDFVVYKTYKIKLSIKKALIVLKQ